jgi:hypothetical protein
MLSVSILEIQLSIFRFLQVEEHLQLSSISIKDFVPAKKSATEKRKSNRNFLLLMKLTTKPLKFKCGLADGGWGVGGLVDPCKSWVPPPSR